MGRKGAKLTEKATRVSDRLVASLSSLGNVLHRKMFGGYGIFENKVMFALVNSEGDVYFKVGQSNQRRFEEVQAKKHGKMPYFEVPPDVLKDERPSKPSRLRYALKKTSWTRSSASSGLRTKL